MIIVPETLLLHLHVVGLVMALLVVINVIVPFRLRWSDDMATLSLVNRQIFQAHSVFLILTLGLFSALLLTCAPTLLEPTRLARAVLTGLTIFWALRMVMQWWFYNPAIWRGHRFYTAMHYLFSVTWIYVTTVFAVALWQTLVRK